MKITAITLTGEIATGKSTIAKELSSLLGGWRIISAGEKFRELTAQKGWSIQKVSFLSDEDHRGVDEWQRTVAKEETNVIIEGRLAGWMTRDLPFVFRVYCYSSLDIRINRYMSREKCTQETAKDDISFRDSRDVYKYQKAYQLDDYRDPSFYNFLLDTSNTQPYELAKNIVSTISSFE